MTTTSDLTTPGGTARGRWGRSGASTVADRRALTVLTVVIVSITLLQRVGIPLGGTQLSVSVPVALGGIAYLLYHGDAVENARATRVFVVAMAVAFLVAGLVMVGDGSGALTSLVYLPLIWVVFCFRLHPARHHLYERVVDRFETVMAVLGGVGVLQTVAQAVGAWTYVDVVKQVVPNAFLFLGYNTSYPIQYGSSIVKANAFVFVEPSVYAQFLALAILSSMVRRVGTFRAIVMAIALVCTISGTGLLFLAFGIAVLALRRGGRWTARIVAAVVVIGGGALLTPFGRIILSRTTETSQTNSSGSLRFVQPYERIAEQWGQDPLTLLIGRGAGSADRLADQIFAATGLPINFSGLAKLLMEYGIPATVLFCAFVAYAVIVRSPSPTLSLASVFASAFLTGSLLQPQVLYVMLPLCSLFLGYRFERDRDRDRRTYRLEHQHHRVATAASAGGPLPVTVPPASPDGGLRRA
ncbi:hypothetical protein [Kineococcus aurantiacus]|uniref:O-antigen ligase like membrane protein n=1 Tax=Kineococcus aurantiacus TaxID=37633 RepID=A0A7Y9DKB1_9ACTN|nr:hypothetical protein [Kineococcus aurantiacus]NYD22167.1 hypothetical protein [Kineococcus aurantiacus]